MQYRARSASVPYVGDESGELSIRPDSPLMRLLQRVGPIEPERHRESLEEIEVEPDPPSLPVVSVPPRRLDMSGARMTARTVPFVAEHLVTPRLPLGAAPLALATTAPSTFDGFATDSVGALALVARDDDERSATYPTVRPPSRRSTWQTLGVAVATSLFTFSVLLGLLAHAHGRAPWAPAQPRVLVAPPAAAATTTPRVLTATAAAPAVAAAMPAVAAALPAVAAAPLAASARASAPATVSERAAAVPTPAPATRDVAAPRAPQKPASVGEERAPERPHHEAGTRVRHAHTPPHRAKGSRAHGKTPRPTPPLHRGAKSGPRVPADELAEFQKAQLHAGF